MDLQLLEIEVVLFHQLLLKLLLQKVLNNIYSIYRKTLRFRSVFFVACLANLEDCQYSRIE